MKFLMDTLGTACSVEYLLHISNFVCDDGLTSATRDPIAWGKALLVHLACVFQDSPVDLVSFSTYLVHIRAWGVEAARHAVEEKTAQRRDEVLRKEQEARDEEGRQNKRQEAREYEEASRREHARTRESTKGPKRPKTRPAAVCLGDNGFLTSSQSLLSYDDRRFDRECCAVTIKHMRSFLRQYEHTNEGPLKAGIQIDQMSPSQLYRQMLLVTHPDKTGNNSIYNVPGIVTSMKNCRT
jgi:hypothetical protein